MASQEVGPAGPSSTHKQHAVNYGKWFRIRPYPGGPYARDVDVTGKRKWNRDSLRGAAVGSLQEVLQPLVGLTYGSLNERKTFSSLEELMSRFAAEQKRKAALQSSPSIGSKRAAGSSIDLGADGATSLAERSKKKRAGQGNSPSTPLHAGASMHGGTTQPEDPEAQRGVSSSAEDSVQQGSAKKPLHGSDNLGEAMPAQAQVVRHGRDVLRGSSKILNNSGQVSFSLGQDGQAPEEQQQLCDLQRQQGQKTAPQQKQQEPALQRQPGQPAAELQQQQPGHRRPLKHHQKRQQQRPQEARQQQHQQLQQLRQQQHCAWQASQQHCMRQLAEDALTQR